VILADHATGHLAALHPRVKRRHDIRDLMLRLTRENLARRCRRRRPSRPASLSTVPLSAGCLADVRHRQLIADGRGAVGVQVGFAGRLRQLPWLRSRATSGSSTHPCRSTGRRARQESRARYRSISALEHIEQYGGYGVGPPRRHQPPSGSGVAHLSPTSRHCSRRPSHAPGWCPGRSWWSWLCAPVPALRLTGRFSGGWSWPLTLAVSSGLRR
jgi:hypothetical protein